MNPHLLLLQLFNLFIKKNSTTSVKSVIAMLAADLGVGSERVKEHKSIVKAGIEEMLNSLAAAAGGEEEKSRRRGEKLAESRRRIAGGE